MRVQRYDISVITDSNMTETAEGYLTVRAPVTKPGVFPYMRGDGVKMEAKLPDELFSASVLHSLNAKPVTDDHPAELVTSANYHKYYKGMTHTDAAVIDNKLFVSFTITDSEMIQKVKNGKRELSLGFSADIKDESGTYNGIKYDSVQRNMQINHLAIVDKGRVGSEASIRGDSAAFMIDSAGINKQGGNNNMAKLVLDSKEYEVDSAVKSRIDALEAQLAAEKFKSDSIDTITGERDGYKTKLETAESELATLKDSALTLDKVEEIAEARVAMINTAQNFLGDSFDFKGKTEKEIKEAVIKTADSEFKADGKSDDYVTAYYDAMTANHKGFTADASFGKSKETSKAGNSREELENLKNKRANMKKEGGN
ncbi:DUF2213 domain-containing protein [Listeria grandensis]|uniref:DUF2213 domain-containing protein n=1 Tax=Listeria grandensis TaxID=1494963 RepID=A0A7X0Y1B5_9LIST|nr:DUF2213 domain-containing protein [Listeria grandensis]MBC1935187.1 DUF2213 domain-containing protein [Listeria grandensis]